VLPSVDQDNLVTVKDLVDAAVVTAPDRMETLEFSHQWFSKPLRVLGDRPEDGLQGGGADLVVESVEMA
jgi:hypothetical protein